MVFFPDNHRHEVHIVNNLRSSLTALSIVIGLGACGGGGSSDSVNASDPSPVAPPPTDAAKTPGLFVKAGSADELGNLLRDGIKNGSYVSRSSQLVLSPDCPNCAVADEAEVVSGDFSRSNVQEAGVDEADIVKYDGSILYQLNMPANIGVVEAQSAASNNPPAPYIKLWQTDPVNATAKSAGRITLSQERFYQAGMYVHANDLLVIQETTPEVDVALFAEPYYWQNGRSVVKRYDVSDSANPTQNLSLQIDGSLLGSRLIDGTLYLITRFSPTIDDIIVYPDGAEQVDSNRKAVDNTKTADLLPRITINRQTQTLTSAVDCYVPNPDYSELPRLPSDGSLVNVTAINLNAPDSVSNFCMSGWVSGFYVSAKSLYLTANVGNNSTLIHKIALADGAPEYRGSGSVPGYIGTHNPAFLMGEKDDALMVFSSYYRDGDFMATVDPLNDVTDNSAVINQSIATYGEHRLTTLRESSSAFALEQVAQLPNENAPARIGKDGESFYSARFAGNKAFAVTFKIIDPLYAFDISDPTTPRLAGELELPGVSHFLQPLGDNYLLGIGQNMAGAQQVTPSGVKVVLFDVTNITAPVVVNDFIIGKRGSRSAAEYDHLALSVLQTEEGYRIALPVERHDKPIDQGGATPPSAWHQWSESALYLFSLSTATGELSLDNKIIAASIDPDFDGSSVQRSLYRSRSVIHNDAVFFSLPPRLLGGRWQ
ncbi:MAG: hypothetical protein CSA53_03750 [Gammaproteobacteria bacterium]|nr:MAG: hypothetical protein CSA53_03750 [Gammaproteobacteria bacterium]